jgi:sulfotransferase
MTGPVGSLVEANLRAMSMSNELAVFVTDQQREAVLRAVFSVFYADHPSGDVVFDTNRMWCSKLPLLTALFPAARVICCVRDIPWIFDSFERLIRRNKFQPSGIFNFDPHGTVYSRVDGLGAASGLVGFAWNALHEACCGEHADRLLLLTYETLTSRPRDALAAVYDFLGEDAFQHNFDDIAFDAAEFDRRIGTPGLHSVAPQVARLERVNLLPPSLIRKYQDDMFWRDPDRLPRRIKVV